MIGQHGIGKSTFLKQFPNSKMYVNVFQDRENFTLECLNQSLEMVNIEIENCDISLETCLFDTELIVNNKVIPSSKIINTCIHKVIILCFAMDDPGSFELIKSKWEIDLKKNKKNRHTFVLLGLKSDTVCSKKDKKNYDIHNGEKIGDCVGVDEELKLKQKKRSYSINSISSTSKLHAQKSPMSNSCDLDEEFTSLKPVRYYKKFAKTIGANSFVRVSNNQDEKSFEKIVSYDKFIQNICKLNKKSFEDGKNNNSSLNSSSESPISSQINDVPIKKLSIRNRIPKSLSAPLKLIQNRKSKTLISLKEQAESDNNQETSFDDRCNELDKKKHKKNEKYENLEQITETSFSIKDKLKGFVIDIGTYVVTCGGTNSRKLAHLKGQNGYGTRLTNRFNSGSNNRSFRRKKSLLLVSSNHSLNTLDNVY